MCVSLAWHLGVFIRRSPLQNTEMVQRSTQIIFITPSTICTHWNMNTVLKLNFTTKIKNESVKVTTWPSAERAAALRVRRLKRTENQQLQYNQVFAIRFCWNIATSVALEWVGSPFLNLSPSLLVWSPPSAIKLRQWLIRQDLQRSLMWKNMIWAFQIAPHGFQRIPS